MKYILDMSWYIDVDHSRGSRPEHPEQFGTRVLLSNWLSPESFQFKACDFVLHREEQSASKLCWWLRSVRLRFGPVKLGQLLPARVTEPLQARCLV